MPENSCPPNATGPCSSRRARSACSATSSPAMSMHSVTLGWTQLTSMTTSSSTRCRIGHVLDPQVAEPVQQCRPHRAADALHVMGPPPGSHLDMIIFCIQNSRQRRTVEPGHWWRAGSDGRGIQLLPPRPLSTRDAHAGREVRDDVTPSTAGRCVGGPSRATVVIGDATAARSARARPRRVGGSWRTTCTAAPCSTGPPGGTVVANVPPRRRRPDCRRGLSRPAPSPPTAEAAEVGAPQAGGFVLLGGSTPR